MVSSTMKFPSCILLLLLILTTHLFIPSLSEQCNPHDKKTLFQIKKQFGNPTKLSSWDSTTDCCNGTWYGVYCDKQTYRVDNLNLENLDLPHPVPIPPSIFNLPFLLYLTLMNTPNLVGTIPPSISNLTKLNSIYIIQTNISGEIPNTLSQIKTLVIIDISDNKLTGPLPASLSTLPNLAGIFFYRNQLTGAIPKSYGSFPKSFVALDLSRNRLSGKIPASLAKLDLQSVDLSRNMLKGDASMFFGSTKQTSEIVLAMNSFAFDFGKVELPKNLGKLDLRNNKIYGTLPEGLTELKFLNFFYVGYNKLCGQIPQGGSLVGFYETSYEHNKCLCGSPLPACKT